MLLTIENLEVFYPDGTAALRGPSLAIDAGERVGLIGPNGAGKTSLLLAIMNGLHFHGRIALGGLELSRRTQVQARRLCGMIFQDADDQLFMPTLLEDVAFGPLNHGLIGPEAEGRSRAAIAAVGLGGLENKSAHHLSGGQKRAAAIATVLAMDVKLLLLDEPAANLDGRSKRRLMALLSSRPEAMLLASHDLDLVDELCSRVVLLDEGKIAADGPASSVLADKTLLEKHGLG
jgi:cobalt/nickel transport system ATP-binding protein